MARNFAAFFLLCAILGVSVAQNPYNPPAPPPDEVGKINSIWAGIKDLMDKEHGKGFPWLRMAHAKQHGCVRAFFQVLPNIPSYAAQGLFDLSKQNSSHVALIRFSNGIARGFTAGFHANETDAIPDTRGFAIKIFGVKGPKIMSGFENAETFDMTFITTRSQFVDTIDNAVGFFKAVHGGLLSESGWLATHPLFAARFAKLSLNGGGVTNLLTQTYWSESPRQHGNTAVKYVVNPCSSNSKRDAFLSASLHDPNFLRTNLKTSLSVGSYCFTLSAQFYKDDRTTPIEDATIDWPTPFVPLANIIIPTQSFGTVGQEAFCRWMSYNPWHSIKEHTPLGVVQRIRNVVYSNGAAYRHQLLNQNNTEPTRIDWDRYSNL